VYTKVRQRQLRCLSGCLGSSFTRCHPTLQEQRRVSTGSIHLTQNAALLSHSCCPSTQATQCASDTLPAVSAGGNGGNATQGTQGPNPWPFIGESPDQPVCISYAACVPQMRVQGPLTNPLPGMPPGTAAHCCCCCCCSLCSADGLPGSAGITVGYTAVMLIAGRPSPTRGLRCCCCWCDGCCAGAAVCAALLPCCCLRWPSAAASPRRAGAAAPLGDARTAAGGTVLRVRGGGRGVHWGSCTARRQRQSIPVS
jgi:hypothetical protein